MTRAPAAGPPTAHAGRVAHTRPTAQQADELRAAVRAGAIVPFYQPIVELDSGRLVGAEALARWIHPRHGVLGPDTFIPVAEHTGLIGELDACIVRQACRDAAGWLPRTPPGRRPRGTHAAPRDAVPPTTPKVSVNVSGGEFLDEGFLELVAGSLGESGLPAGALVLEITESAAEVDDPRAQFAIDRLRGLGVAIAIDDFGTGFSNLARLGSIAADILKVDRSFVRQLDGAPRPRALVRGVLSLAARLGLQTIVEGIETPQQAAFVTAAGADLGQGWLFGAPVPHASFPRSELVPGGPALLEPARR